MLLYDTVNIWIDSHDTPTGKPFDVSGYLDGEPDFTVRQDGTIEKIIGHIRNYSVKLYPYGIKLNGSLPKLLKQSNIDYLTTIEEAKQAIEYLSDSLHVDIAKGIIKSLHIAGNIQTDYKPTDYYPSLGEKKGFFRNLKYLKMGTLYYDQQLKRPTMQMYFYDKTKELQDKEKVIPPEFLDVNLLRYEVRLYKPQKNLKLPEPPRVKLLYERDFSINSVELWRQQYGSINKINPKSNEYGNNNNLISIFMNNTKKYKRPADMATAILLQQLGGGQSAVDMYMATLKAMNYYQNPSQYTRERARVKRILAAQTTIDNKNDLIRELETKINDIADRAIAI